MIVLLLSLLLGLGVFLVYEGLTNPRPPRQEDSRLRPVAEFLARAGLHEVTPRGFLLFSLGTGALGGVLAQLLLDWGAASLIGLALGLGAPLAYYVRRHDRRRAAYQGALAEAMAQLRDAVAAGFSIQEGLLALARTGPEALRPEFAVLARQSRLLGLPAALEAMQARLADPVFDVVAASLLLNDRLGGRNVSQVLDRLAVATRAQLRVQEEIRAGQARNVLSARIIAAVPLVLMVAIRRLNPAYLAVFDGWPGQLILLGSLGSIVFGYAAMLWVTRLPQEPRVLR